MKPIHEECQIYEPDTRSPCCTLRYVRHPSGGCLFTRAKTKLPQIKRVKNQSFCPFFLPDAERVDEPESEPFVFCCPVSPHAVLHSNFLPMPVKYELNRLLCFLEKSDRGSICHVYIRNSILSTPFILKNKIVLDSDTVSKVLL